MAMPLGAPEEARMTTEPQWHPPHAHVDELVQIALTAGHSAADLLLRSQPRIRRSKAKSSPTDPVTEADRAAERILVDAIQASRPEDGVIAEEGTRLSGTSGLRWVIDPLDGTVNYLYQRADWAVSLAVEDDAGALVGVVVDPVRHETFHATRGGGAYLNARPLRVNDPVSAGMALVATGFSYRAEARRRQSGLFGRLIPYVRDIRRTGACSTDLCALAAGRADAFLEDELAPWDWAAGALIAREAGATVTPLRAGSDNPGLLAAGSALHGELAPLIDPADPAGPR
jgi:myo-inositol-1(or 4)-monophosphatase